MTRSHNIQASREVMKRLSWLRWLAILLQLVAIALAFSGAALADTIYVTDDGDAGPDTFRAAVMAANGDPAIDTIMFASPLSVTLESEVHYTGSQDLAIAGSGSTRRDGIGFFWANCMNWARVFPWTSCIVMNRKSSVSPTSYTGMMLGWERMATDSASCWKSSADFAVIRLLGRTLTAIWRFRDF